MCVPINQSYWLIKLTSKHHAKYVCNKCWRASLCIINCYSALTAQADLNLRHGTGEYEVPMHSQHWGHVLFTCYEFATKFLHSCFLNYKRKKRNVFIFNVFGCRSTNNSNFNLSPEQRGTKRVFSTTSAQPQWRCSVHCKRRSTTPRLQHSLSKSRPQHSNFIAKLMQSRGAEVQRWASSGHLAPQ